MKKFKKAKRKFVQDRVYRFGLKDDNSSIKFSRKETKISYGWDDPAMQQIYERLHRLYFWVAFWKAYRLAQENEDYRFYYERKLQI